MHKPFSSSKFTNSPGNLMFVPWKPLGVREKKLVNTAPGNSTNKMLRLTNDMFCSIPLNELNTFESDLISTENFQKFV